MNDEKPQRRSIRLPGYDYSLPGYYYLTLCTHQHQCLFGDIQNALPIYSSMGQIAREEWLRLPERFSHIVLDGFVIMPNHLHAILQIVEDVHGTPQVMQYQKQIRGSVAAIMQAYKASVTRRLRKQMGMEALVVWQRGYWERVLRNEKEIEVRRYYIANNPNRWQEDRLHL